jgi:hypothetical protein
MKCAFGYIALDRLAAVVADQTDFVQPVERPSKGDGKDPGLDQMKARASAGQSNS